MVEWIIVVFFTKAKYKVIDLGRMFWQSALVVASLNFEIYTHVDENMHINFTIYQIIQFRCIITVSYSIYLQLC